MYKHFWFIVNSVFGATIGAAAALLAAKFNLISESNSGFVLTGTGFSLMLVGTWAWFLGAPTEEEVEVALYHLDEPFGTSEEVAVKIEEQRHGGREESRFFSAPLPRQVLPCLIHMKKRGEVVARYIHVVDEDRHRVLPTFALRERVSSG